KPTAPPRAKVAVIFGTRPEAIKLAPVVLALRDHAAFTCRVCVTAQHRQMLDQVLEVFGIRPDDDLDLMQPNQTPGGLTARAIDALDRSLARGRPELVLVRCLAGAAAAALLVEHRAYRTLSARFFTEHMAGRLVGDARNWLNHTSLRRAGFTVVLLGAGR